MFNLDNPAHFVCAELDTHKMGKQISDPKEKVRINNTARDAVKAAGLKPHKYFYHQKGDDAEARGDAEAYAELIRQALANADVDYPVNVGEGFTL